MDPVKVQAILEAIKAFINFAEKVEALADPEEKSTIEDAILKFLKVLVEKIG